jgi:hypothetical protein
MKTAQIKVPVSEITVHTAPFYFLIVKAVYALCEKTKTL